MYSKQSVILAQICVNITSLIYTERRHDCAEKLLIISLKWINTLNKVNKTFLNEKEKLQSVMSLIYTERRKVSAKKLQNKM